MSDGNAAGGGIATVDPQRGERSVTSSAGAGPFADVTHDADAAGVRTFLSPQTAPEGHGGAAPSAPRERDAGTGSSLPPSQFAEETQSADIGAVRPMLGGTSPEAALTGTGFSYRHNWGARRGQWTLRLNWGAVNARSRVMVSVAEGAAGGPDAGKFIGAARYTIHNVAPRAGGVDIWVNIEWGSDILLYVDYLIINP